jgi:hypothetical protein
MSLEWAETIAAFVVAVALYVWANLVARRPVDLLRPRLISPVLVMSVSAIVAILMLAHMVSLATGTPFAGGSP